MRGALVLMGLAGATILAAIATPLDSHRTAVPRSEDVAKLETLLAARISTGLWAPRNPPGARPSPPDRAMPPDRYVRHYALVNLRSEEDLPFTTFEDAPEGDSKFVGRRIVGVLASPAVVQRPAGIVIDETGRLPQFIHGGCTVVNVVYDPDTGQLVSAWCNVPAPY